MNNTIVVLLGFGVLALLIMERRSPAAAPPASPPPREPGFLEALPDISREVCEWWESFNESEPPSTFPTVGDSPAYGGDRV